jgi:hypothetical protein
MTFYIPFGALALAYRDAHAFEFGEVETPPWVHALDDWLTTLGEAVYRRAPFRLACVGMEMLADVWNADFVARHGIPAERPVGPLRPDTSGQLDWYPANR